METLRYGGRGDAVRLLQLGLYRSGNAPGEIDGIFGTRTLNAVRRFQTQNGLAPDGIAGERTWAALRPFLVGYVTAIIKAGDSFYRLARRYGITVEAIAAANPDIDPLNLIIGSPIIIPLSFNVVPTNIPYTSRLAAYIAEGLSKRYPFIRVESIGSSVLGAPLNCYAIGSGSKEVFINASHHANEWITTPLVLKYLESYLSAYVNKGTIYGKSALDIYNGVTLYAVPLVNPDGVDLVNNAIPISTQAYTEAVEIAENFPRIPFPSGWKANVNGVDLNLNYPADWELAREIKFAQGYTKPAPRDFVGTAPLSARESLAVYSFTLEHDFVLTLSYHTQGKVIYWKYQDIEPPQGRRIGQLLAEASGYALEDVPTESSYAGYKDWFILNYNRPAYTIEAGIGVNPLPLSQFDAIYQDNVGLITVALSESIRL